MTGETNRSLIRGNVIVEDIRIGDIHYEYEYGMGIKCKVITLHVLNEENQWEWRNINVNNKREISYLADPKYVHHSANIYDYENLILG